MHNRIKFSPFSAIIAFDSLSVVQTRERITNSFSAFWKRMRRRERQEEELEEEKEEFEIDDEEEIGEWKRSRWWRRFSAVFGSESIGIGGGGRRRRRGAADRFVIHPDNWWYVVWTHFILVWAVYSSFVTPLEFGFFRGLPENLCRLDSAGQIVFFIDIFVRFFVSYPDFHAHRIVSDRKLIALRYFKSRFLVDLMGCMPWDAIYKASVKQEPVRYLLWIRLSRACRVTELFEKLEKDIRINYLGTRIVKLFVVELYCTHTAACIFYYLATTLPPSKEGYTWIGSLKMGDYSYSNFREVDLWKRYITSLYFAVVTMATVGYGEIHAVNVREMIFIMLYVSFDMILGAYLLGNMTALIVKGSKTEKFRDQVTDLIKYMNRNKLDKHISKEIKSHLRLQYDRSYAKSDVLQDIPSSIRCKISQSLYEPFIKKVPLFSGCSQGFIKQIASRVHEEFFLPGEVILERGNVIDQLYVVCHGELDEVDKGEDDEPEELVRCLETYSSFGEISFLCNSPQPYTILVRELCRVLRLDKQSFREILEIYFLDGRTIFSNLLEGKDSNLQNEIQGSDVSMFIGKHEFELAMKVNCAAHDGDFFRLKSLIRAGADPKRTDYDGRSPLHFSASKGYTDITCFLIEQGVQVNLSGVYFIRADLAFGGKLETGAFNNDVLTDKFGNSPLFQAIKNGHDQVVSVLVEAGATLDLDDAGGFLCSTVARRDLDLLVRVLANGIDPNARNYDHRTPLHIAAGEGLYLFSEVLLKAGASVLSKDRWGNTPLDESRINGNKNLIKLLDVARTSQLSTCSSSYKNLQEEPCRKKCTVFAFHPFKPKKEREDGVVLWVAPTIEELIRVAMEELKCPHASSILSENGGRIIDPVMITDNDKLFLI